MFDRALIQQVLDANPIQDLVSEYVTLRKRGSNLVGLCPFHDERTPSFSVNPSRGIFKCFGCGQGGNAITFLMEIDRLSFVEAIRNLASRAGIKLDEKPLTPEKARELSHREECLAVTQWALSHFQKQLHDSADGKRIAHPYLQHRGIDQTSIARFQIGYAPAGNTLLKAAAGAGFSNQILIEAGLVIQNGDDLYDRFRDRIIFPILSESGRPIGFGGRALKSSERIAKYINSPESPIYHKGETLFGLHQARKSLSKLDKCLLVEGYLDVISMHQRGIEHVVASAGTALTDTQIQRIARYTKSITLLYDGDSAGMLAADRAAALILQRGLTARIVPLPDGQDPDDFARSLSNDQLEANLQSLEMDYVEHASLRILRETKDPIQRAKRLEHVLQVVAVIPDAILRQLYVQSIARRFELAEQAIHQQLNQLIARQQYAQQLERVRKQRQNGQIEPQQTPENPRNDPFYPLNHPEEPLEAKAPPLPAGSDAPPHALSAEKPAPHPIDASLLQAQREITQLLLNHGARQLSPPTPEEPELTVARYLITLVDKYQIPIDSPPYEEIYGAYQNHVLHGEPDPTEGLLQHPDPETARTIVQLTVPDHAISKIWYAGKKPPTTHTYELIARCDSVVLSAKALLLERRARTLMQELLTLPEGQDPASLLHEIEMNNKQRARYAKELNRIKH